MNSISGKPNNPNGRKTFLLYRILANKCRRNDQISKLPSCNPSLFQIESDNGHQEILKSLSVRLLGNFTKKESGCHH